MKSKIKIVLSIAIAVSIILSVLLVSTSTFAAATTSVSLNPPSIAGQSIGLGKTFVVTANISTSDNIWGWSLSLSWNSSILQMVNFAEGSFLSSSGQTSLTSAPIDNNVGTISNINDVLTSQNSASGAGNLLFVTFQVVGLGSTQINLANVQLLGPASSSSTSNPQIPALITSATFSDIESPDLMVTPSASLSDAAFSAVQSGTTTSSISVGPTPDPFNSTIKIDIRVDGVTTGFWGWTISTVNWNPAVLTLTKITEGSFLADNTGGDPTSFVGNSKTLWNLTGGSIMGGISEAISAADTSIDPSGVVATLSFNVTGYGTSAITIAGGNLRATSSDTSGTSVTCNSATITVLTNNPTPTPTPISGTPTPTPSPTPTPISGTPTPTPSPTPTPISGTQGPVASFTPQNQTTFAVGSTLLLDASSSKAGYDNEVCSITNYTWTVQYPDLSILGIYTGPTVAFKVPNTTTLKITLTVTAPDINSPPSPSYNAVSTAVSFIQVGSVQSGNIDVFTDKGGIGQNVNAGIYNSQDLVKTYALVTYGGVPVLAGNLVAFAVFAPGGNASIYRVPQTNDTGYAFMEFKLPDPVSNPQSIGVWSIVASVTVNSIVVTDSLNFTYSNNVIIVNSSSFSIGGIQLPANVSRSNNINLNVSINAIANSTSSLTVTICDQQEVPIACYSVNVTSISGGTVLVPVQLFIPSWSYVGTATLYVDLMTNLPSASGVPLCPEKTATTQILS